MNNVVFNTIFDYINFQKYCPICAEELRLISNYNTKVIDNDGIKQIHISDKNNLMIIDDSNQIIYNDFFSKDVCKNSLFYIKFSAECPNLYSHYYSSCISDFNITNSIDSLILDYEKIYLIDSENSNIRINIFFQYPAEKNIQNNTFNLGSTPKTKFTRQILQDNGKIDSTSISTEFINPIKIKSIKPNLIFKKVEMMMCLL